mmetsp:Transcript_44521/g.32626  ORF Transcript_44521/g.32626 Transcript_44521/m.32626 type:complete len:87 (+) Transcript_44521:1196-1456(+)
MTSAYGFRLTCDYIAFFMLAFSIIYFIICNGPKAFRESNCSQEGIDMDVSNRSYMLGIGSMSHNVTQDKIVEFSRRKSSYRLSFDQ